MNCFSFRPHSPVALGIANNEVVICVCSDCVCISYLPVISAKRSTNAAVTNFLAVIPQVLYSLGYIFLLVLRCNCFLMLRYGVDYGLGLARQSIKELDRQ